MQAREFCLRAFFMAIYSRGGTMPFHSVISLMAYSSVPADCADLLADDADCLLMEQAASKKGIFVT